MPRVWHALILLALAGYLPGQQPKSQPKLSTSAGGVFLGVSGKPMAGARLLLGEVLEDRDAVHGKIKILPNVPTATADKSGRYEFRGFAPGEYAIVYFPAGVEAVVPNEFSISMLEMVDKSITPLLRNHELGKSTPYKDRQWGPQFTLLQGHTLYSMGQQMKLWNATVRRGLKGPYMEVRRGVIWHQVINDKSEIKFDAWSY